MDPSIIARHKKQHQLQRKKEQKQQYETDVSPMLEEQLGFPVAHATYERLYKQMPDYLRRHIPALQPCETQSRYQFRIVQEDGKIVCRDIRELMHLYSLKEMDLFNTILQSGNNSSRAMGRWQLVNPFKGVAPMFTPSESQIFFPTFLPASDDPNSTIRFVYSSNHLEYLVGIGASFIGVPNRVLETWLGKRHPVIGKKSSLVRLRYFTKQIENVIVTRVEDDNGAISYIDCHGKVMNPSFIDQEFRVQALQDEIFVEIESQHIENAHRAYASLRDTERGPNENMCVMPFSLYHRFGDGAVKVTPKIIPKCVHFILIPLTDATERYRNDAQNGLLVEEVLNNIFLLHQDQIIAVPIKNESTPMMFRVTDIYGYVKNGRSVYYTIERVGVAALGKGEYLYDYGVQKCVYTSAQEVWKEDFQNNQLLGWEQSLSDELKVKKSLQERVSVIQEPAFYNSQFMIPPTRKEVEDFRFAPLTPLEVSHWNQILKTLPQVKEVVPKADANRISGVWVLFPHEKREKVYRYNLDEERWYEVRQSFLTGNMSAPLTDQEFKQLLQPKNIHLFAVGESGKLLQAIPNKSVTFKMVDD